MKREKKLIIKKKDWEKLTNLFDKLYEKTEDLYNSFGGIKIYRELGRYAEFLRGKIGEIEKQKQEINPKLAKVWEMGVNDGIYFCNGELGEFGGMIEENIEAGVFPRSYDWDKRLSKYVNREKKLILKGGVE